MRLWGEKYQVIRDGGSNFEYWNELEPVLQELARDLHCDIRVDNPHGLPSTASSTRDEFQIRFWSCPGEFGKRVIERAFGIALGSGQADGCFPSGKGFILHDPAGQAVAEVLGSTLFVLFDLPHGWNAGQLMREIITIARQADAFAILDKKENAVTKEEEEDDRTRYIAQCKRRLVDSQRTTAGDLKAQEQLVADLSRRLVVASRDLEALRFRSADNTQQEKLMMERFGAEYDRLLQTPGVKKVTVMTGGTVDIFTETIFLEYDGQRYELGDYRISIHSDGGLSIANERVDELTGQEFYHHPHIFRAGGSDVCLGNIGPGVHKLIGSYEYAVAAQVLIRFLQSITNGEPYVSYLVKHWKPVPKKEEQ